MSLTSTTTHLIRWNVRNWVKTLVYNRHTDTHARAYTLAVSIDMNVLARARIYQHRVIIFFYTVSRWKWSHNFHCYLLPINSVRVSQPCFLVGTYQSWSRDPNQQHTMNGFIEKEAFQRICCRPRGWNLISFLILALFGVSSEMFTTNKADLVCGRINLIKIIVRNLQSNPMFHHSGINLREYLPLLKGILKKSLNNSGIWWKNLWESRRESQMESR